MVFLSTNTPHWPFIPKEEDAIAIQEEFKKSVISKNNININDQIKILFYHECYQAVFLFNI